MLQRRRTAGGEVSRRGTGVSQARRRASSIPYLQDVMARNSKNHMLQWL